MSSWPTIRLVAAREVRVRLASRATRIGTALLVAAVVALIVVISLISGGGSADKVAFTQETSALAQPLQASAEALGEDVETSTVPDAAAGEQQVRDGADDQQVLAAAIATGPVHEFAHRPPSLAELFRHAVSEETTG